MHNTFISIVNVVHSPEEIRLVPDYVRQLDPLLREHFSDFEIILVNNLPGRQLSQVIDPLPAELKHQLYVLNLSSPTNKNHAFVAGLDRANGDYTVLFEFDFVQEPEWILRLYERTREQFDIVYLQARERQTNWPLPWFYQLFYWILRRYSRLKVDSKAHNTRIISRRALNSLLRLRENLRYMKAIYSIVGYNTTAIPTDIPLRDEVESFRERFSASLIAITSFTTFLNAVLFWIFIFSSIFMVGVIVNALKVKFVGADLLGNPQQAVSGWTFLVVLSSVFFAITCLILYIMSIYLANIYHEIKKRPLYIIESVQRF